MALRNPTDPFGDNSLLYSYTFTDSNGNATLDDQQGVNPIIYASVTDVQSGTSPSGYRWLQSTGNLHRTSASMGLSGNVDATLCVWVYFTGGRDTWTETTIGQNGDVNNIGVDAYESAGSQYFLGVEGGSGTYISGITAGWRHLTVVVDSATGTVEYFLDGLSKATHTRAVNFDNTKSLDIYSSVAGDGWTDIQVYNRKLTPAEILKVKDDDFAQAVDNIATPDSIEFKSFFSYPDLPLARRLGNLDPFNDGSLLESYTFTNADGTTTLSNEQGDNVFGGSLTNITTTASNIHSFNEFGTSYFVSSTNNIKLNGNVDATVCGFVYSENGADNWSEVTFGGQGQIGNFGIGVAIVSGEIKCTLLANGSGLYLGVFSEGWHFVAGVYNSVTGIVEYYVDGASAGTRTESITFDNTKTVDWYDQNQVARITDIMLFNRTLSLSELEDIRLDNFLLYKDEIVIPDEAFSTLVSDPILITTTGGVDVKPDSVISYFTSDIPYYVGDPSVYVIPLSPISIFDTFIPEYLGQPPLSGEVQFQFEDNGDNSGSEGGSLFVYGGDWGYADTVYGRGFTPTTADSSAKFSTQSVSTTPVFTLTARIKSVYSASYGVIVSTFYSSGGFELTIYKNALSFAWYESGSQRSTSLGSIVAGEETHIAIVLDGSKIDFYKNKALYTTTIINGVYDYSGANSGILVCASVYRNGFFSNGIVTLDNISFYTKTLSLGEIATDYNNYLVMPQTSITISADDLELPIVFLDAIINPPLAPNIRFMFENNLDNTGDGGGSALLVNSGDSFQYVTSDYGTGLQALGATYGLHFPTTLIQNSPEFSLAFRVNIQNINTLVPIIDTLVNNNGFIVYVRQEGVIVQWYNELGQQATLQYNPSPFPLNQELHFVFKTDVSINGMALYINGSRHDQMENIQYIYANAKTEFNMFATNNGAYVIPNINYMDNIGFYDFELTDEQILYDFNNYTEWGGTVLVLADNPSLLSNFDTPYVYTKHVADSILLVSALDDGVMTTDVICEAEIADKLGDGSIITFFNADKGSRDTEQNILMARLSENGLNYKLMRDTYGFHCHGDDDNGLANVQNNTPTGLGGVQILPLTYSHSFDFIMYYNPDATDNGSTDANKYIFSLFNDYGLLEQQSLTGVIDIFNTKQYRLGYYGFDNPNGLPILNFGQTYTHTFTFFNDMGGTNYTYARYYLDGVFMLEILGTIVNSDYLPTNFEIGHRFSLGSTTDVDFIGDRNSYDYNVPVTINNIRFYDKILSDSEIATLAGCTKINTVFQHVVLADSPLLTLVLYPRTAVFFTLGDYTSNINTYVYQPAILTMPVRVDAVMFMSFTMYEPIVAGNILEPPMLVSTLLWDDLPIYQDYSEFIPFIGAVDGGWVIVSGANTGYAQDGDSLFLPITSDTIYEGNSILVNIDDAPIMELELEEIFYSGNLYRIIFSSVTPKSLLLTLDVNSIFNGDNVYITPRAIDIELASDPIGVNSLTMASDLHTGLVLLSPTRIGGGSSSTVGRLVRYIDTVFIDGLLDYEGDFKNTPSIGVKSSPTLDGGSVQNVLPYKELSQPHNIMTRQGSFVSQICYNGLREIINTEVHTMYFTDGTFLRFRFDVLNNAIDVQAMYDGSDYYKLTIKVLT